MPGFGCDDDDGGGDHWRSEQPKHYQWRSPEELDPSVQHQEAPLLLCQSCQEVADDADLLFSEALNALGQIAEKKCKAGSPKSNMKLQESRLIIVELEGILQKEKAEFEETLQKVVRKESKKGEPGIERIPAQFGKGPRAAH